MPQPGPTYKPETKHTSLHNAKMKLMLHPEAHSDLLRYSFGRWHPTRQAYRPKREEFQVKSTLDKIGPNI